MKCRHQFVTGKVHHRVYFKCTYLEAVDHKKHRADLGQGAELFWFTGHRNEGRIQR